jgi:putative DNA primase/helicase
LTSHGFKDASTDHTKIDAWWDANPYANIGVAVPESVIVIDVDANHGGLPTALDLLSTHGPLPPTKMHVTGGDDGTGTNTHSWFTVTVPTADIGQSSLGPGVDLRVGGKGYVVVHGLHQSGRCYNNLTPGEPAAPLPHEWYDAIIKKKPKPVAPQAGSAPPSYTGSNRAWVEAAVDGELAKLRAAPEGQRNNTLIAVSCRLFELVKGGHVDERWARQALTDIARQIGEDEYKIRGTLAQAWARTKPVQPPAPREPVAPARPFDPAVEMAATTVKESAMRPPVGGETAPADVHRGQLRYAYLLAGDQRDKLLHVHGIGWYYWDGTRWAVDDLGVAKQAVYELLHQQWQYAWGDKALAHELKQCSSAAAIAGILSLAASLPEFACTVGDLDADPYLLNVANGTLDLHELNLRPHSPGDRITKVCRGAYRQGETAPTWTAFLGRVLPDEDVRGFVHRLAGMALIGRVNEHVLPIWTGTGRNGKGTLYKALLYTMGDYASTADPELFMARRDGAHPTGEMDLMGRRLVVVSESNKDRRLDEAKMKRLVGGDPIKARHMRKDFVQFEPSHTAVLVTNHLPKVSGDDPATWARLRVVPFNIVIPASEQDPRLDEQLALEADGVLAWAVDGLRDYLTNRLAEPPGVVGATEHYHRDMDAVARFISECCDVGPGDQATTGELHQEWVRWQQQDGCDPMSLKAFGQALDQRGYAARKGAGGVRFRYGIGVSPPSQQFDPQAENAATCGGGASGALSGSTPHAGVFGVHTDDAPHAPPGCSECGGQLSPGDPNPQCPFCRRWTV